VKGQKEAVVELVKACLPNFHPYKDIALISLSKDMLESIKYQVGCDIVHGNVEYGKDRGNHNEVMAYARSMVMNHLKKARELNGNQVYGKTSAVVQSSKQEKKLSTLNIDILPDDLKAYVKKLV
jgi:hypothetical protein